MNKSIEDYKELYKIFIRTKDTKPQQDYTVLLNGKEKEEKPEKK